MTLHDKVVLITGGAKRVGAAIARHLHRSGARLMLHYRASAGAARLLQAELNHARPDSVALIQSDLLDMGKLPAVVEQTISHFGQLDAMVNKVANALVEMGIGHGDKVALDCPNLPYFPIVYYAIMKTGAVVVPICVLFTPREIEYQLRGDIFA